MSADDQNHAFEDDVTPEEDAALDSHESAPQEPDSPPANGPASAAPPRIVAEAPLGGVPKPIVPPVPNGPRSRATSPDTVTSGDASTSPAPDPLESAEPTAPHDAPPVPEEAPVAPPDPNESTMESPTLAAEARRIMAESRAEADDAGTPQADAPGDDAAPEPDAPKADTAAEKTTDAADQPVPPAKRPLPPAPEPVADVGMADADDFEDISPELAAILGKPAQPAKPAAASPADSAPAAEPAPAAAPTPESKPEPEPEPAAAPVELTDIAEVRTLPITAEQRSAPAPDTTLTGKVRYVRVEEPLRSDEGQRIQETWEYLKPDYPALGGRLVKEITIEEITYADGSWEWRYERRYTDKGRDSREVRANADRSYIEREDEVSRLDAETGRRLQFREEAELIFAPPEKEEKRGGLLGGLFGRGDDEDKHAGPKSWRVATSSEVKQARKQGGEAFKRGGFLGL